MPIKQYNGRRCSLRLGHFTEELTFSPRRKEGAIPDKMLGYSRQKDSMGKMGMSLTCSKDRRKPEWPQGSTCRRMARAEAREVARCVRAGEPCRDRFGFHCKSRFFGGCKQEDTL